MLVNAALTGVTWYFSPLWKGADLWSTPIATVARPSAFDAAVRPWVTWVGGLIVLLLAAAWLASFAIRIGDANVIAWTVGASSFIALLAATDNGHLGKLAVAGLAARPCCACPRRLKNGLGAFALIGIPWLIFVAVMAAPQVGRFTLYTAGDDCWHFQRFAYRIVMQGYWLEGGSPTFWFQPLYRWIAGALHMFFGDSSVGEWYWDGACVLAMAAVGFHVARSFAGFRWGLWPRR